MGALCHQILWLYIRQEDNFIAAEVLPWGIANIRADDCAFEGTRQE